MTSHYSGIPAAVALIGLTLLSSCEPKISVTAEASESFSNPIISGFAPDPSIVRVGEDFYLITSSFEYVPGIPIYHSNDLVNWELIGHALQEPGEVELQRVQSGSGIHASTIRYHDGTFYIVTTNNVDGRMVNFIVTATDPSGPWSAPHVLENAPGIDPSLLFDDDGRVWYVGNHMPLDPEFPGQAEIWLQEVDIKEMRLTGKRHYLWRGCCQGVWAEGPHIYKKDGYYYLLISEGGTAYEHAMSVAISKEITGPYQNNPRNPVLSHRQFSYDYPITGVGHADLVELADGRWYSVALAWRLVEGAHGLLGRETFLVPVTWETEPYAWKSEKLTFPVFAPLTGKVELRTPLPFAGKRQNEVASFRDDFDELKLRNEWNFRRAPLMTFHDLQSSPGALRLMLQSGSIGEGEQYSFIGIRQRHFQFEAVTATRFAPTADGEEAGISALLNDRSAFLLTAGKNDAGLSVRLSHNVDGERNEIAAAAVDTSNLFLKVTGDYLNYQFYYSEDGESWTAVGGEVDGKQLSPAVVGGYNYTGVYIGLYASANNRESDNYADFEFFQYSPTENSRDDWFRRQLSYANSR